MSKYDIDVKRSAQKAISELPIEVHERVSAAIRALQNEPRPHGIKKLQGIFAPGRHKVYRIRVGDYRVTYTIDDATRSVSVLVVDNRDSVYR